MLKIRFLLLWFLLPFLLPAQQSKPVKTVTETTFLRDVMGAKYSKSDKMWALPRTQAIKDSFAMDLEGGLFARVDTIITRDIGDGKETWVLFTVEGHVFSMARLEAVKGGWQLKNIRYHLHEGAHGEYAPLKYGFRVIGGKTFVSIEEMWYAIGITTTKWLLYDPFTGRKAGEFDLAREGGKEQNLEVYTEFSTEKTTFPAGASALPDLILTQKLAQKTKGKPVKESVREVKYRWDSQAKRYLALKDKKTTGKK
jgi:hypothetical protein